MFFKLLLVCSFLISASSYAFEKTGDLREKSPHAPLCRCTLNSAKERILWQSPEKQEPFSWPSYHDFSMLKHHIEPLPGDLKIMLSEFTERQDYSTERQDYSTERQDYSKVLKDLHSYNNKTNFNDSPTFSAPDAQISGNSCGEYIVIDQITTPHIEKTIQTIENEFSSKQKKKFYIFLSTSQKAKEPYLKASERLQKMGYKVLLDKTYFETENQQELLMKEVKNRPSPPPTSFSLSWKENPLDVIPTLSKSFGIFLRDDAGMIQGGAWGKILKDANIPHAQISIFFINKSLRDRGPGHILIKEVEKYIVSLNLKYIMLKIFAFEETRSLHTPLYTRTLNPAKGRTIWQSPETQEHFSWPSYHTGILKHQTETLPGDLEITLSDFTERRDYSKVLKGLHDYNKKNLNLFYCSYPVFRTPDAQISGNSCGESIFIEKLNTLHIEETIQTIEYDFFFKNGKRLYIFLSNSQESIVPHLEASERLQKMGYKVLSDMTDFKTGNQEYLLIKEMKECPSPPSTSISLSWEEYPLDVMPVISENFGIFLRDDKGLIQGGAWGEILKNAHIPHAHLDILFINESLRGRGLSQILMKELENHVKSFELKYILLETLDHQAPLLYERLNYKRIQTLPKFVEDKKGNFLNFYFYCKELTLPKMSQKASFSSN